MKEVADKITDVVKEVAPHILFIPHRGDLCYDHRIVHEASLVAARPCVIKIKRILSYEVPSETDWALSPFLANVYVDIKEWMDKKIEAMKAYKSELKESLIPEALMECMHMQEREDMKQEWSLQKHLFSSETSFKRDFCLSLPLFVLASCRSSLKLLKIISSFLNLL
jgi:LmbE family N-acetylglucosaminyl deacetylase